MVKDFIAFAAALSLFGVDATGQCPSYHSTGTSYDDDNITVIENIKSTGDCCDAATAFNSKSAQKGKLAVWWKAESLCLVKATGNKPVDRKLTASVVLASQLNEPMPLYLLPKEMSTDRGAVCLDGSPPGFYGSFSNNSATATKWVLYFKGGGWCYDEASCASRAKGNLGSSTKFAPTFEFSGMMDSQESVNPVSPLVIESIRLFMIVHSQEFHDYNRVVLYYCDGASFSGNADKPYFHAKTNQTLYFRWGPPPPQRFGAGIGLPTRSSATRSPDAPVPVIHLV
jgi:hypothetical protein